MIKNNQSNLLSDKCLGYAAEWAVYESISCSDSYHDMIKLDKRLDSIVLSSTQSDIDQFETLYRLMTIKSKKKLIIHKSFGYNMINPMRPDMNHPTCKVDISCDQFDIHVKFNDNRRLFGFQKSSDGDDPSKTSEIFYKVIRSLSKDMNIDKMFMNQHGLLKRPLAIKGMSKMNNEQLSVAKEIKQKFLVQRASYRKHFISLPKNGGNRDKLIKQLNQSNFHMSLCNDIIMTLSNARDRKSIYFKFSRKSNNIKLETHEYLLNDIIAHEVLDEKNIFYKISDANDHDKIYFNVEFRLDGGGHPPQLKVGKDLHEKTIIK